MVMMGGGYRKVSSPFPLAGISLEIALLAFLSNISLSYCFSSSRLDSLLSLWKELWSSSSWGRRLGARTRGFYPSEPLPLSLLICKTGTIITTQEA